MHVTHSRGSVLLRQVDEIRGGRGSFGVFFPTNNALYSKPFGTHTNMAETIERDEMLSELGPRKTCYVGLTITEGKGNFGGNVCPTNLIPIIIANWTGP